MNTKLNAAAQKFGQQAELVIAHINKLAVSETEEGASYRAYLQRLASLTTSGPDDEHLVETLENSSIQAYVAELAGDDAATISGLMEIAGKVELAISVTSQ